ncbi:hypothetical protein F5883DRAFT_651767 [Diaporthe sp. PMI_573]|nr:hypothetical protein F5883DRAFT_651767 [Diaporthaceae sp. PMI_573]
MNVAWERLIRFISTDGLVLWGEPILPNADFDLGTTTVDTRLRAKVVGGNDIYDTTGATKVTEEVVTVEKLLGPLESGDVPILRCVGLNYKAHILEAGRKVPPFPSVFFKPSTAVIGHEEMSLFPELPKTTKPIMRCVIIGRDAKDVSEETALDYVAGYTIGNDISSRKLQRDPNLAGSVPQWGFSKGFDTFAPLGPALVSSRLIDDPALHGLLHLWRVLAVPGVHVRKVLRSSRQPVPFPLPDYRTINTGLLVGFCATIKPGYLADFPISLFDRFQIDIGIGWDLAIRSTDGLL